MTNVSLIGRSAQNLTKSKEYRAIDIYIMIRGKGFIGLRPLPFGLPPLRMRGMTNVRNIGRCAQNLTKSKEYLAIDIYICFGGKASLVYAPCPSGFPLFA